MTIRGVTRASSRAKSGLGAQLRLEAEILLGVFRWWPVWVTVILFAGGLVVAYQTPGSYFVAVGTPQDEAYVRNFHARLTDSDRNYRWSDIYGYISFPGVGGSRAFTVTATIDAGRATPVQIFVNGDELLASNFQVGWQTIALRVDASHPHALQSRDTVVEIRSSDYRTEDAPTEPKGVKVSNVTLVQDSEGNFIVPALAPLGWLSISVLLVYLLTSRALTGFALLSRARLWGLAAMVAVSVALLVAFVQARVAVAAASTHIAVTFLTTFFIAVVCEVVFRTLDSRLSPLQLRVLALSFGTAFLLRFGGMALPQSVIIDMPWHMKWLNTLLAGDWRSLYFPGGLSSVPAEWGMELLIPKSPLFYFIFSPLSILPFELETSVKWLISLLDSSLVLVVLRLSLALQSRVGAAVAGAWLYSLIPLAFRAFAYGILPTILAQSLAAIFLLAIVLLSRRKWNLVDWLGLVALALLTFLSFPTVALFVTLVVGAYAFMLFVRQGYAAGRPLAARLVVVSVVGWLAALWAYYGLYISPVLASAQALLVPKPGQTSTVHWPGGFAELVARTADYVVTLLPCLLALTGIALLFAMRRASTGSAGALLVVALWLGILPLFTLVNYRVDMIGKHLFFTMLPVAVLGGVTLYLVGRLGRWGLALASIALAIVGWQGLVFWVQRLVQAST